MILVLDLMGIHPSYASFTIRAAMMRAAYRVLFLGMLCLLAGCATRDGDNTLQTLSHSPWAAASLRTADPDAWHHQTFPGKRSSQYSYKRKAGRDAVMVQAHASASMLRQRVRIEPDALGQLRFSWLVPALIVQADLAQRDADDAPVRLVLAFEGNRTRFSAKDSALSDLSEALTGEPLPYATLMYVWSNQRAAGTVIHNPRTSRIRKLVMETGEGRLGQWLDYERDVQADFLQAFGEPPGAMVAIGIMTDTDNTRAQALAWYGALQHHPRSAKPVTAQVD